tara:strand:- start:47 stop:232 length:186 start_codon:yes stop_codon:yes gene_type:complete
MNIKQTSEIKEDKDFIRLFWHASRASAFCPRYWLEDYKQGRKHGNNIIRQTYYTDADVSGK